MNIEFRKDMIRDDAILASTAWSGLRRFAIAAWKVFLVVAPAILVAIGAISAWILKVLVGAALIEGEYTDGTSGGYNHSTGQTDHKPGWRY